MPFRTFAALVLPLLLTPAFAQTAPAKRPMTFADLQAMKRVSDPQISPSGKWVLFSVTDVSLEKNSKTNHLWAVPLDGHAKEAQITSGSGESNGRFSPDGEWVMYSSAETGSAQIWIAPWDEAAGKMGPGHVVTALETEADGGLWAPDSKHFLFVSNVYPECEAKATWEGAGAFRPLNNTATNGGFSPGVVKRDEEEANCNAFKDAAAAKDPVKAQVFDHLLYRHWNAYTGAKHSHIFCASTEGTHIVPTDLTPASVIGDHEAPTFSLGGPLGYAISPDGKEVAYVVNRDKVPAESTNNDIYVLQLGADPATARKVSTSPGSDDGPQYSPNGKYLAWRSQARNGYESDKFDLVVMDRATGKMKNLTTKFDGWVDEFAWAPDSDELYFASARVGREPLFKLSPTTESISELEDGLSPCMENYGRQEYSSIQVTPDSKALITMKMLVDRPSEIVRLDRVKGGFQDSNSCRYGPNAYSEPLDQRPITSLRVVRGEDFRLANVLTHLNDAILSQLSLQHLYSFWFPGANGTKIQGFLTRPPNFDPAKKYPVKFLIHGGPQGAWGDAWSYRWNPELFAANGYVVVMVNPRGSTGYGQKFLEEVSGDWGGRAYEDLMKGLDYAEQHYTFIDKDRECALGASYGGYMANWVLTHTDRFKCIVTHDGMYNPQSAFGTTEELWFNEWEFRPLAKAGRAPKNLSSRSAAEGSASRNPGAPSAINQGAPSSPAASSRAKVGSQDALVEQTTPAHPWDFYDFPASQDPFRKWSPMLAIKNAHTPTLVVHGQRDYRLDVSEGFQLFTALQLLGVPSKMLYFPDEGHWVLKPKNSQLWYETVNDWCDRWLGMNKYANLGPEKNPAAVPLKPKLPIVRSSGVKGGF